MYSQVGTGREETTTRCCTGTRAARFLLGRSFLTQYTDCMHSQFAPISYPLPRCLVACAACRLQFRPRSTNAPHIVRSMRVCWLDQSDQEDHNEATSPKAFATECASASLMTGIAASSCAVEHASCSGTMCSQIGNGQEETAVCCCTGLRTCRVSIILARGHLQHRKCRLGFKKAYWGVTYHHFSTCTSAKEQQC